MIDENLIQEISGILAAEGTPLTTREIYAKAEQADGVASVATALHHMVERREARAITVIEGPRKFTLDDGNGQASTHAWRQPWTDRKPQKIGARTGILGALTGGPMTTAQLRDAMPELRGRALQNALSALRREGKIDNDGRGTPWHRVGADGEQTNLPTTDQVREHVRETAQRITQGEPARPDDTGPLTEEQVKQKLDELREETRGTDRPMTTMQPPIRPATAAPSTQKTAHSVQNSVQAPAAEPDDFVCAMDSKGRLRIQQGGEEILVAARNTEVVRTYLAAFAYTHFEGRAQ